MAHAADFWKRIRKTVFAVLFLAVYSTGLAFCSEYIFRKTLPDTISYVFHNLLLFFLSCIVIFLIGLLCSLLTASYTAGAALSGGIAFVFAFASYQKILYRNEPVLPADLFSIGETLKISDKVHLYFSAEIFFMLFYVLLSVAAFYLFHRKWGIHPKLKAPIKVASAAACAFVLFFSVRTTLANPDFTVKRNITISQWAQLQTAEENGLIPAFLMNIALMGVDAPEHYSKQIMQTLGEELAEYPVRQGETPDIIVVMSESFFDIDNAQGLVFDREITPNFRRLQENFLSGNVYMSHYGGNTSNSEFEFLTGLSTAFLNPSTAVYQQYLRGKNVPGLVSFLKGRGYVARAIHPYDPNFWDRSRVYSLLGFDAFLSQDDFEEADLFQSLYITDEALYRKIIEEYEGNLADGGAPYFNFNVTIQNHAAYDLAAVAEADRVGLLEDNGIDPALADSCRAYASGLAKSDQALAMLLEYFEQVDRDVIVVIFGDHLPVLGQGGLQDMYDIGYTSTDKSSIDQQADIYSTPYVIWNNFGAGVMEQDYDISLYQLAPLLLHAFDLPAPPFFNYLYEQSQFFKGHIPTLYLDAAGAPVAVLDDTAYIYYVKHQLYEYEILFGNYLSAGVFDGTS